jgi:hypothetical protein
MRILAIPTLALALLLASPAAALAKPSASGPTAPTPTGNDVSYPQCKGTLPSGQAFGIVGINGGKASNTNPCFAKQWKWALGSTGKTNQPPAQLYVNTANPGDVLQQYAVTDWPTSGPSPYGDCVPTTGNYLNTTDSIQCSYVYGYQRAQDDVTYIRSQGVTTPEAYNYFLDVEYANSWTNDPAKNSAALEGMVAYFKSLSATVTVGVYASSNDWANIGFTAGSTGNLANLPNWVPGATTLTGAQANCTHATLLGNGYVSITQYVSHNLDYDYSCQ